MNSSQKTNEDNERIAQNEKLREMIVDLADFWDGKESIKYGTKLQTILREIGIHDVPRRYSEDFHKTLVSTLSGTDSYHFTLKEKSEY